MAVMAIFFTGQLRAQHNSKPVVDTTVINNWMDVDEPKISNDGLYAGYIVRKGGFGGNYTLHVKATTSSWHKEFGFVKTYLFLGKKKQVLIHNSGDSLVLYELGTAKIKYIPGVLTYETLEGQEQEYLLYQKINGDLIVLNTASGKQLNFPSVSLWYASKKSSKIILLSKVDNGLLLSWIDPSANTRTKLGEFTAIGNLVMDNEGKQLAFLVDSSGKKSLWHADLLTSTLKKITPLVTEKGNDMITEVQKFSKDGKHLFVKQIDKQIKDAHHDHPNLLIWNYLDHNLQSQQVQESPDYSYVSVIELNNNHLSRIEYKHEKISLFIDAQKYLVINQQIANRSERHWNPLAVEKHYLYNIAKKTKIEIPIDPDAISPDEKFLAGRDSLYTELRLYNIETNKTMTIAKVPILSTVDSLAYEDREWFWFAGWKGNDKLLFYDEYDVWETGLKNTDKPVNLTNGYGRRNRIRFRLASQLNDFAIDHDNKFILNAFDIQTKENGFYVLNNKSPKPIKLSMHDKLFNAPTNLLIPGFYPVKAKNADIWIVRSETASQSQNYEITKDFKKFTTISEVRPEVNCNWLTDTLISFKTLSGESNKAIMYLPENFDSNKKYPVIINYYERLTDLLHVFLKPALSLDHINIPWFVSKGYIVCAPDIIYKKGETGKSAVNAIKGLANYLSTFSYVDSNHIGIDGHSFGGYETNFIVTHSTRFVAAMSSSGFSDLISHYGSVMNSGGANVMPDWAEIGQGRLEHSLWERPDLYIKNSPIFFVDKVNTPVLAMNNAKDGIINLSQGIEFFQGLRRQRKAVWVLQYSRGYHSLMEKKDQWDYTNRIEQFFGHYLKGEPMPEWMKAPDQ
jgi:dienelactone hydrolase